ncbi:MAG: polyribonucleotide nucleotidyltransferase [Candidatus Sungbacteria bacterium RIFCSPLOWO2_12_FULL_41_11]|uniref:Polyribonucleotide nucleotidyltransferase n=1 Tax=Candidatus Sungbacteria bacterium RIFCSPLOWO2_12_FULL_41_11 TaxID=1802286 RepID=A0A1G2LT13_9BACT|nr:MAG: polyribonucleotide nucleotidyltransferase [Candidatus Sungbacteria bacterium RIFCSPHIGHO2_02_FULL_41_12b]OHA14770.1 MAG: polyribonucleotide nucleotidyltransferase [Candidatus Sungbacteria bacterium RIFCSPLOWO2_12_FULL_41_11]
MKKEKFSHDLAGRQFTIELSDIAEQAHGRVLVRYGDTLVLATVVMNKKPREGGNYFPLMVDYEEKFYAAGKILGSRFIKRETRPSEEAILVARLIDRSIRPRFDLRIRNDVQVIVTVLSIDEKNDPDVPSLLAASLALSLSPIPWAGPIAGVRVGKIDGKFIINPTFEERQASVLDCIVSGTEAKINMVEAGAKEISEEELLEGMKQAHEEIKKIIAFQKSIVEKAGAKKRILSFPETPEALIKNLKKHISQRLGDALYEKDKTARQEKVEGLKEEWMAFAVETHPDFNKAMLEYLFEEEINEILHKRIIEKGERPDGRKPDELRELYSEVGLLPRTHGSALFVRGQTQALSAATLGAPGDEQIVEGMEVRMKRRFMHHYNFPPYSVGETGFMRGPGRREIGHGALAERSLAPLIPSKEEFPYTIRLVSEILSSNGSSSMASVCGSVLAMMDAGIPIKKPAAGIAMGLMMDAEGKYKVLTDIQGPEDHHGDMDFKAAGTRDGITGIQMDVKIEGVTLEILRDTLAQAKDVRLQILAHMASVLPTHRPELSPLAPRVIVLKINPEKIGALIGPGGKMINELIAKYNVEIDIEDDGTVFITSEDAESMQKALAEIKQITKEIKPGELLEGRVTRIFGFGAMVEFAPRQDGMVHISELAPWRVERVEDIVNIGDIIPVMVKEIDEQGRVNLSLKSVPGRYSDAEIQKGQAESASRPSRSGGFSGFRGGGRGGPRY